MAAITACSLALLAAQAPTTPAPTQTEAPPSVISVQTNLILVRVVVRDGHGNAVAGLGQSDFQIFDSGKPQAISFFSAENGTAQPAGAETPPTGQTGAPPANPLAPGSSERYTALFFDDYHLQFEDLARTRTAAQGFITKALSAGDRIGIFTPSGQPTLDFTTDADKLQKALSELRIQTQANPVEAECPPLPPYLAQLDLDDALTPDQVKQVRSMTAACVGPAPVAMLDNIARDTARRIIDHSDIFAQGTLVALQNLVRYIEKLPGERRIAMVSDGFQNRTHQYAMNEVINEAIRGNVIINAMDAQGLTVENRKFDQGLDPDAGVIEDAAKGTGGVFVEDTNDYLGGLERLGGVAEASYVLGFAPDELSFDGRYHKLRTVVSTHRFWAVQARAGYFAMPPAAAAETADLQEQASYDEVLATTNADQQIRLGQDFLQNYSGSRFAESVSNRLVQAFYSKKDWNDFYSASDAALAKYPGDVDVLVLTGWVISRLQDPSDSGAAAKLTQAESDLKHAIQIIPTMPKPAGLTDEQFSNYKTSETRLAQSGLGLVYFRRRDYQNSVPELQQATLGAASHDPTDLWALGIGLQQLKRYADAADAFEKCGQAPGSLQDPCKQLAHQVRDEKGKLHEPLWSPPDVDAPLAAINTAQTCSLPDVLAHAGERAQELVANLQRFAAHEKVQYQELDSSGMLSRNEITNYDYVVSFQERAGGPLISESRRLPGGGKGLTSGPPDVGLPSLALILHPYYRSDYDMRCEGLADWEGTPAWVVHFVQRTDKPSRMGAVTTSLGEFPLNLKGRAWIAADSYQVLHIETNLVGPVSLRRPDSDATAINRLDSESMSINYAPVEFQAQNVQLWLPQSAESFTESAAVFSEEIFRSIIKHTFADFVLFSVQSNQAVEKPVQP